MLLVDNTFYLYTSGPNVIKTDYDRNLQIFEMRQCVFPWQAFPAWPPMLQNF